MVQKKDAVNMTRVTGPLIIPNMNGMFLGDTVLLSALVNYEARRSPGREIVGAEDAHTIHGFGMQQFAIPPKRVFAGTTLSNAVASTIEYMLDRGFTPEIFIAADHNSRTIEESVLTRVNVRKVGLWAALNKAVQEGVYPRVQIGEEWSDRARRRLARLGVAPYKYFVLHVRQLDRAPEKNISVALVASIVERIKREIRVPVLIIGSGDRRRQFEFSGSFDLLDQSLAIQETAAILQMSLGYLGGDSGPTHLASALGVRICGINYSTSQFGPFVPPSQMLGRFGPKESVDVIVSALSTTVTCKPDGREKQL